MNRYQVKLPNKNNDNSNTYNNNTNNNHNNNNASNSNNRDNYFSPGRQNRTGGNGQFNSPSMRGDIDQNLNYNETKWTQNFGQFYAQIQCRRWEIEESISQNQGRKSMFEVSCERAMLQKLRQSSHLRSSAW